MKKITLCIALFTLSFSCFSQTDSDRRRNEGVCFQSIMEKASRSGYQSVDKSLIKWANTNFDAANRVAALSKPGGKCVGADNDCFKRNLSQSDFAFGIGMSQAMGMFESPQDPKKLPHLEIGLMTCISILK
jgi:hypothetical protein